MINEKPTKEHTTPRPWRIVHSPIAQVWIVFGASEEGKVKCEKVAYFFKESDAEQAVNGFDELESKLAASDALVRELVVVLTDANDELSCHYNAYCQHNYDDNLMESMKSILKKAENHLNPER